MLDLMYIYYDKSTFKNNKIRYTLCKSTKLQLLLLLFFKLNLKCDKQCKSVNSPLRQLRLSGRLCSTSQEGFIYWEEQFTSYWLKEKKCGGLRSHHLQKLNDSKKSQISVTNKQCMEQCNKVTTNQKPHSDGSYIMSTLSAKFNENIF